MNRSVRSRAAKQGAADAKARGVKLGNARIEQARKKANAALRAKSDAFARKMRPVLAVIKREAIEREGIASYRGIARILNKRGIPSALGGRWQAVQVAAIVRRLEKLRDA
jgi:hypothetical protein